MAISKELLDQLIADYKKPKSLVAGWNNQRSKVICVPVFHCHN